MALINPHINFNGNAEEAFNFYKSVFGGEFAQDHAVQRARWSGFSSRSSRRKQNNAYCLTNRPKRFNGQ